MMLMQNALQKHASLWGEVGETVQHLSLRKWREENEAAAAATRAAATVALTRTCYWLGLRFTQNLERQACPEDPPPASPPLRPPTTCNPTLLHSDQSPHCIAVNPQLLVRCAKEYLSRFCKDTNTTTPPFQTLLALWTTT